jgi:hypothetical protein
VYLYWRTSEKKLRDRIENGSRGSRLQVLAGTSVTEEENTYENHKERHHEMKDTPLPPVKQQLNQAQKLDAGIADAGDEADIFKSDKGTKAENTSDTAFDVVTGEWVAADSGYLKPKSIAKRYVNEKGERMSWVRSCHQGIHKKVDGEMELVPVRRRPHFKLFTDIKAEIGSGGVAAPRIIVPPYNHRALHDDLANIWKRYLGRRGYDVVENPQPKYARYGDAPRRFACRSDGLVTRKKGAVRHYVEVIRTHELGENKFDTLDEFDHAEGVTIWVFDVGPPSVLVRLLALYEHWQSCTDEDDIIAAEEAIIRYAKGPCIIELKNGGAK